MSSASPAEWKGPPSNSTFLGHPVGLFVLFITEMWERFSFHGMRGLLQLYMVNYLFLTVRQTLQGKEYDGTGNPDDVLGWGLARSLLPAMKPERLQQCAAKQVTDLLARNEGMAADLAQTIATQKCGVDLSASVIYSVYLILVALTPLLGGWIADHHLGQRKSVYVGAILITLGQFVLFGAANLFFIALLLLAIGSGFFRPSITTQVGSLYPPGDTRRDRGFTLFYAGIHLGAFVCNVVCGTLAALYGWRYGFLAAGIGMCIGLLAQFLGRNYLAPDTMRERKVNGAQATEEQPLTSNEWERVWLLVALCLLNAGFWAAYGQYDFTMYRWAAGQPDSLAWLQSRDPFLVFILAPLLVGFWTWQKKRGTEPLSLAKMALGCFILSGSFLVMFLGVRFASGGSGSLLWPLFCTLLLTLGELYLAPAGMSLVTKTAPTRLVSLMVGVWLLSSFAGSLLAAFIGRFFLEMPVEAIALLLMVLGIALGTTLGLLKWPLRRVRQ